MKEAPANSVPAAAVIRGVQALFGIIGRKGRVGCIRSDVKVQSSPLKVHLKPLYLSMGEGSGIPGVEVKFVDIWRNTGGEGDFLDQY